MEILKLLIENPFSTLIVLSSLSIFVYVVSKYVPNPIDKIHEIFKILKHEGNPMTKKEWVERINWFSILFFALAFFFQLLIFGSSSILSSVISESDRNYLPITVTLTLIFLFAIIIYSQILIILTRGDSLLNRKAENFLGK